MSTYMSAELVVDLHGMQIVQLRVSDECVHCLAATDAIEEKDMDSDEVPICGGQRQCVVSFWPMSLCSHGVGGETKNSIRYRAQS